MSEPIAYIVCGCGLKRVVAGQDGFVKGIDSSYIAHANVPDVLDGCCVDNDFPIVTQAVVVLVDKRSNLD